MITGLLFVVKYCHFIYFIEFKGNACMFRCGKSSFWNVQFKKHCSSKHNSQSQYYFRLFQFILKLMEVILKRMKSINSFFELNQILFLLWDAISSIMGSSSEVLKDYAKTSKYHQNSWELIINFSEILTIYVRSLLHENIDPSNANVEEFLLYCS